MRNRKERTRSQKIVARSGLGSFFIFTGLSAIILRIPEFGGARWIWAGTAALGLVSGLVSLFGIWPRPWPTPLPKPGAGLEAAGKTAAAPPEPRQRTFPESVWTELVQIPEVEKPGVSATDLAGGPQCLKYATALEYGPWREFGDGLEYLDKGDSNAHRLVSAPDGRSLLWETRDRYAHVFRILNGETGQCDRRLVGLPHLVHTVCSPAGAPLVAFGGYDDNAVSLFSAPDWNFIGHLPDCGDSVRSICFSSDFTRCATGHGDGMVRLWDLNSRNLCLTSRKLVTSVSRCVFLGANVLYASASEGRLILWETGRNQTVGLIMDSQWSLDELAVSQDQSWIAYADHNSTITIMTCPEFETIREFRLAKVRSLFFVGNDLLILCSHGLFRARKTGSTTFSDLVPVLGAQEGSSLNWASKMPGGDWVLMVRNTQSGDKESIEHIVRLRL
jgi:WD40 repeat protein